jgi:hypothetical protein
MLIKLISATLDNSIIMSILNAYSLPFENVNGTGMAKLCDQQTPELRILHRAASGIPEPGTLL